MPLLDNGERVEVCFNSSTYFNRENPGQVMEMSLNFIGSRILDHLNHTNLGPGWEDYAIYNILKYLYHVSSEEATFLENVLNDPINTQEDIVTYIENTINDGYICTSNKPMSESMTLDKLDAIYKEFPFIKPYHVISMIKDSNGNYRPVPARRPVVCGRIYIYRLKQYAEEKFSVTSLSSTNIRNENTRNKANKNYKALHTSTPIRFGEMETEDFIHIGAENVVSALMIHSVSPQARRLLEQALTGDPYHVDIVLNSDSKNRNVEILNAYLKTMGLRLTFKKIKKKKVRLMRKPLMVKVDDTKKLMRKVRVKESMRVQGKPYVEWCIEMMKQKESLHKLMTPLLMSKVENKEEDKSDGV